MDIILKSSSSSARDVVFHLKVNIMLSSFENIIGDVPILFIPHYICIKQNQNVIIVLWITLYKQSNFSETEF